METPKIKPVAMKRIVPIKGNLLQKLKNELRNCNSSSDNIVIDSINNNSAKNSLKPDQKPTSEKVIIQKVENVNFEISEVCASEQNEQNENQTVNQVDISYNTHSSSKSPIKLLSAEMPVNEKNVTVPLRLIRTVRAPKVRPQILKRYHKIQLNTSVASKQSVDNNATINHGAEINIVNPYQDFVAVAPSEELQPKIAQDSSSDEEFFGFSPSENLEIDTGRWKKILRMEEDSPDPTILVPQNNVTRRIISKVSKQSILDKLKMKMSPQKLKDCEPTKGEFSTFNELLPSQINEHPNILELHRPHLVTSTPLILHNRKQTIFEPAPTVSHSSMIHDDMPWQDDIFSVIGLKRIEEIDENLKEIPNLVTGNAIETENVEFKLIINHMKKLLGVDSIKQTLNLKPTNKTKESIVEKEDVIDDGDDATTGDESNPYFDDSPNQSIEELDPNTQEEIDLYENNALSKEHFSDHESGGYNSEYLDHVPKEEIIVNKTEDIHYTLMDVQQTIQLETNSYCEEFVELNADYPQDNVHPETDKENVEIFEKEISENTSEIESKEIKNILNKALEPKRKRGRPPKQHRKNSMKEISTKKSVKQIQDEKTDSDSDVPILLTKRRRVVIDSDSNHSEIAKAPCISPLITSNVTEEATVEKIPDGDHSHKRKSRKASRKEAKDQIKKSGKIKKETKNLKVKQKQKPSKKLQTNLSPDKGRKKPVVNRYAHVIKKVFQQAAIEKAVEAQVPYEPIISSINISNTEAKRGRRMKNAEDPFENENKQLKKKLQSLKVFKCGNCSFDVTKHLWRQHVMDHGGICWIDGFEAPYDFQDWNECLRRMINTFKVYHIDNMTCPNCDEVKKSALGHMSHATICGESEEVLDKRKQACELCNEKVLPFMTSFHRSKCSALIKVQKCVQEPEQTLGDQSLTAETFSVTGRLKRQAVRKAETSFKKIAKSLTDVDEYIAVAGKFFKCTICIANFNKKEVLIDHIRQEHNPNDEGDFDNSESEADIRENESSDSDGSSGCESSEIETDKDFEEGENDENKSNKRSREGNHDSEEIKHGKTIIGDFRIKKLSHFTYKETLEQLKTFCHNKQILTNLVPTYLPSRNDVRNTMKSLEFIIQSKEFSNCLVNSYSSKFFEHSDQRLTRLEIGQLQLEDDIITMYCGGTISSIDWAPVTCESEFDFLAVACNKSKEFTVNLEETSISVIQIYQFSSFKEESTKDSTLSYIFSVSEGPIWSIKFHPNQSTLENRIGLLAVTTANQNILVFSLPFIKESNSQILLIEACLICKLNYNDDLLEDKYLYQATRVNWFVDRFGETYLCGGYINGLLALWEVGDKDKILLPKYTTQAHQECISSLDTKASGDDSFNILTASHDRRIKTFVVQDNFIRETSTFLSLSRVSAAEWWMNWPGFIMGHDDCYGISRILHRQPLEFAGRNQSILQQSFSIKSFSINHWNNTVLIVTGSGEVLSCRPTCGLMKEKNIKNSWSQFNFNIESFTDIQISESGEEIGLVFCDLKKQVTSQPNSFRTPPVERINDLMINHVCFNRNEKRHHFYALGYETGFVRIKHLKNSN